MRGKIMQKKMMTCGLLALFSPMCFAGGATVSGFADITLTSDSDQRTFLANAEVDVSNKLSEKVAVQVDFDLALGVTGAGATNGSNSSAAGISSGPADSAVLEQAFFSYSAMPNVTVLGGLFNNPIGWEAEDAPGLYQISHGQIWGILDGQTALYGNNVAGVGLAGSVGPATITLAALNDIGLSDLEKNSFAAVANLSPTKGADVEIGYVTQPNGAGNVWDVNAAYSIMGATVGVEVLGAENVVDLAYAGTVNYMVNNLFGATVRFDNVSYEAAGTKDSKTYALAGIVNAAKNLTVLLEFHRSDDGTTEDDMIVAEFVAQF